MLGVAALCGLACAALVYLGTREPQLKPKELIVREAFQVQVPTSGDWKMDEERRQKEGADLVLEGTSSAFFPGYFVVQVIRPSSQPVSPVELAEQVKKDWQQQIDGCQFIESGTPAPAAGLPALRLVAVGNAVPEVRDTPRREAYVLIVNGLGYRLNCIGYARNFESLRPAFDELIASFQARTPGKEP
jgi:hypothetical protein